MPHPALAADLIFATFWCAPGIAPADYASRRPDLRFADAIRAAHAGKRVHVAVLTDTETTVLEGGDGDGSGDGSGGAGAGAGAGVEVFRCAAIERARVGRNSYANWAQLTAQAAYLVHLDELSRGGGGPPHPPVVFCDTDILVVDDLSEMFAPAAPGAPEAVLPRPPGLAEKMASVAENAAPLLHSTPFDYGLTVSDAVDMPVNFGLQVVPAGGAPRAVAFLAGVCSVYDFSRTFVAGQEAVGAFTGLIDDAALNVAVRRAAYTSPTGRALVAAADGSRVAFFPCLKYNYCRCGQSCCTDPGREDGEPGDHASAPTDAAGFAAVPVKVFHAVGHRKPGFDVALAAFLRGGAPAAYAAIAALPDEEGDYVAAFGADAVASGRAAAVECAVEAALAAAKDLGAAAGGGARAPLGKGGDRHPAATAKAGEEEADGVPALVGKGGDAAAITAAADSDSDGLAPATAPASRDPSPPRKKAQVAAAAAAAAAGEVAVR